MVQVTDATILYFFSTYSQSVAALVGLSATFAVFHYQNLRNYYFEKVKKISEIFKCEYTWVLSDGEKVEFKRFVNDEKRIPYVKSIYKKTSDSKVRENVESKLNNSAIKINEFYSWKDEFSDYDNAKIKMINFRKSFLVSSAFGLLLVIFGLAAIFITDFKHFEDYRLFCIILAILLLFLYLFSIIRMLINALQKTEL